jgi:hypothetical protein
MHANLIDQVHDQDAYQFEDEHLYEVYNPMPFEAARDMEVELAIGLWEAGYGVWQA